jgi:cysteine synthase A
MASAMTAPLSVLAEREPHATDREWTSWALGRLAAEAAEAPATPLLRLALPADWGIELLLKDESAHPTASLKHRLARALLSHAIASGWIGPDTVLVEASSGSTAISEAYFARLLGLDLVAVMPRGSTAGALVARHGGRCRYVDDPADIGNVARRLADETGGHFVDQFVYAERAYDGRGTDTVAYEAFEQLTRDGGPEPDWVVVGAGTGGTATAFGRHIRFRAARTRVAVVEPEGSCHFPGCCGTTCGCGSLIEGIGRPCLEASFLLSLVDRMLQVADVASLAAMRVVSDLLHRRVGGSTGTNVWGALHLADAMRRAGRQGRILTLIGDHGDRYATTYYDDDWLRSRGLDIAPFVDQLRSILPGLDG